MSPLDEPYSLWTVNHIFLPFVFVNETGRPWLTFFGVLAWELGEVLYFAVNKNYGPLFLLDANKETVWNVWVHDVGGGVLGIWMALSFHYISTNTTEDEFWAPFKIKPKDSLCVRVIRFFVLAISFSLLAAIGWECQTTLPSLCKDGYNTFPWGAVGMLPIAVIYTWFTRLSNYTYILIFLLFVPAFIPPSAGWAPTSVLQLATIAPLTLFLFVGCLWHRYKQSEYDN